MPIRIVVSEKMPQPGMALIEARSGLDIHVLREPTQAALLAAAPNAEAVILVAEQPRLTADVISAAPRLRLAARMGAGTDNFDRPALAARGIPLLTTGGANAGTVAEHALYLMLALAKRGPVRDRAIKAGAWPRGFGAIELAGRTCLIVGLGRIGREIARRAAAFDMTMIGVDPAISAGAAVAIGIELLPSLAEALPRADVVVLACALTDHTRGLIGADALARMKPGAVIVNVARGPIIDEAALARALQEGRIGGAGLDVMAVEPPRSDNPLLARDDVVLTPHTASHAAEAYDRMSLVCARAVIDALDGRVEPSLLAR